MPPRLPFRLLNGRAQTPATPFLLDGFQQEPFTPILGQPKQPNEVGDANRETPHVDGLLALVH
jgi:hypothetical protein